MTSAGSLIHICIKLARLEAILHHGGCKAASRSLRVRRCTAVLAEQCPDHLRLATHVRKLLALLIDLLLLHNNLVVLE